jgi:hypothetical protein
MEYRGLRIARDILFRVFIIGYGIIVLAWLLFMGFRGQWEALFLNQWHVAKPELLDVFTLAYFTLAKFVLLMYALVPAIAIHLTIRKWEKKTS